ncbi:MAG: hypothetical protein JXA25_01125 [Anaerolineales bacterium]|nr:hypothetical protein [Anaerolineales bacterium]
MKKITTMTGNTTMTENGKSSLKPMLAVVTLGTTLGGWGLLAKNQMDKAAVSMESLPTTSVSETQLLTENLPPIPTVAALIEYAAADQSEISLDMEPVPVVVDPGPRQQVFQQAPASSSPQPRQPVTSSGSSN